MPSARAALIETSMMRPRMNGPRSLTRHWIERPLCETVTMLPSGLVRCAQVIFAVTAMPTIIGRHPGFGMHSRHRAEQAGRDQNHPYQMMLPAKVEMA